MSARGKDAIFLGQSNSSADQPDLILEIVIRHLKALFGELTLAISDGTWKTAELYLPVRGALLLAYRDILTTLDKYFISYDCTELHKDLITIGLDFIQRWEIWTNNLSRGDMRSGASKLLHISLIRFSKGIIKSYRIWRIDTQK